MTENKPPSDTHENTPSRTSAPTTFPLQVSHPSPSVIQGRRVKVLVVDDDPRFQDNGPKAANPDILNINDKPDELLRKLLSTKFAITDSSLFVTQYHEALRFNSRRYAENSPPGFDRRLHVQKSTAAVPLRKIGWGSCGVVHEEKGTIHIVKRAIKVSDGNLGLAEECRLSNDFTMHERIEKAFGELGLFDNSDYHPALIPRLHNYLEKTERSCWRMTAELFSEGDRTPEDLLIAECIPPVHLVARHALIDHYCPEQLKPLVRTQDSNDDCLVRLYLGKRRDATDRPRTRRFFGLRNFPLCLDQMQDLGLDTKGYAYTMAHALATMHWKVQIDAADVEFVLGGRPSLAHGPIPSTAYDKVTHVWLLDFNQCQPMQMDQAGVDQAVKRFFDNDPYYPRPGQEDANEKDADLWQFFAHTYLAISAHLVDGVNAQLPELFITKVQEGMVSKRKEKARRAEGNPPSE